MTTKEYLGQISSYDALINAKMLEIEQLRTMASKITVAMGDDRVQTSGSKDRIGDSVVKIIDKVDELHEVLDKFYEKREEIIFRMETLADAEEYRALFMKYVCGMTIEKMAEDLCVSEATVKRLTRRALEHFEDKYYHQYCNLSSLNLYDLE